MKTQSTQKLVCILIIIAISLNLNLTSYAQDSFKKTSLAILNIDTQGLKFTPQQMGNLVRIEMQKLDSFEVIDRYDVAYLVDKHNLNIENCYGKICLVETGKIISTKKMLSGSIELYGRTIIITLRYIDVPNARIERTHVREFLNLPNELQSMISITVRELFGMPVDDELITKLTKQYNYDNAINNPNKVRLSLAGPRMGATYFHGRTADYITMPENQGGFDASPYMFQFGYQIELQYLTHGNLQALFEIVPNITGLDQGLFLPSISFMQGLRHAKNGFEFAFGPIISLTYKAEGYYDENQDWHLAKDWTSFDPIPYPTETRFDKRGDIFVNPGFILGIGKTFKSGNLNIPVNAFFIPRKDSFQFGLSFGYNAKKDK